MIGARKSQKVTKPRSSYPNFSESNSSSTIPDILSENSYGKQIEDPYASDTDSSNDDVIEIPLLEKILQYRKPDDDLFKFVSGNARLSTDNDVPIIGLPFSDDESDEDTLPKILTKDEIKQILDDENNQFSKEHMDTMNEIEDHKSLNVSPPCSTCSLCSSCTEDTLEVLGIDENDVSISPEPLDKETIEQFEKLNQEHYDILNSLMSATITDTEDNEEKSEDIELNDKTESNSEEYDDAVNGISDIRSVQKFSERPRKRYEMRRQSRYDDKSDVGTSSSRRSSSGISKMLSTYDDEFFLAPPDYDYFLDEKPPYSANLDNDLPWDIRERSRKKCSSWLTKYHDIKN